MGNGPHGGAGRFRQVGRREFQLQAAFSRAHEDKGELQGGFVQENREVLFETEGAAATPHIAGERGQVLEGDGIDFLVAAHPGGCLQIDFEIPGHDANQGAGFVPADEDGFEYAVDVFAQGVGHMPGAEVVFVDPVGDEFVGDSQAIEHPGGVGFPGGRHGTESEKGGEEDEKHAEPLDGGDGFAGPDESEEGGDDGGEVFEEGEAFEGEVALGLVPGEEGQGGGAEGQDADEEPGGGVRGQGERAAEEEGSGENPESAEEDGPRGEREGAEAAGEGAAEDGVEGPAEAGEEDEEVAPGERMDAEAAGSEDAEDEQDAEESEDDGGEPAGGEGVAEGEADQHDEEGDPGFEEGGVDDGDGSLGAEEQPGHEGGADESPEGEEGPVAEARREGAAAFAEEREDEEEGGGEEIAGGGDGFGGEGAGGHEDASDGEHDPPAEDGKEGPGEAGENGSAGGHGRLFSHMRSVLSKRNGCRFPAGVVPALGVLRMDTGARFIAGTRMGRGNWRVLLDGEGGKGEDGRT